MRLCDRASPESLFATSIGPIALPSMSIGDDATGLQMEASLGFDDAPAVTVVIAAVRVGDVSTIVFAAGPDEDATTAAADRTLAASLSS